ncbi:MAG TPA: YdeI/OmpD-associated family protein [Deinococcales bacterium]|nr:YdeI/OmpD-associated family protein [Deinococcales bacterium]
MKFRAALLLEGKTATGIRVPEEVVEALGSGRRPAVQATLNGYTYRSTVATMGGAFMLPVSAEVRGRAGVAAGDEVEVEVVLDTAPRTIDLPPDLAEALDALPEARAAYEGLSYSKRRGLVEPIEQAKAAETRARRIAAALEKLRRGEV